MPRFVAAVLVEGVVFVPDEPAGSKTHPRPIVLGEKAGAALDKLACLFLLIGSAHLQIVLQLLQVGVELLEGGYGVH